MDNMGRILIADDEETFARSTADLLRLQGYECVWVPDAMVAAEHLRSDDFDLLIADIRMPGNADLEFVQELPQIAAGTPVILITAYPSLRSAIRSVQLPVVAYLVKPYDVDELLETVRKSIQHSQTYQAVCSTRQRLQEWSQDLEKVESFLREEKEPDGAMHVDTYVSLTLQNIVGALVDLKNLASALAAQQNPKDGICGLFTCPRIDGIQDLLKEAATTLETTKTVFKSKELRDLRVKLEGLIEEKQ